MSLLPTLLLFLQESAPAPKSGGSALQNLAPFAIIAALFFFLMILPERKKQKQRQSMLDALKKGDAVMTSAGIFGTVVSATPEIVVLQVADGVRMRFARTAVQSLITPEKDAATQAEPSKA